MGRKKYTDYLINAMRIIVALVFVFSGFVKAVDPWGTAIKIGEYFSAFSIDWLSGTEMFLSILQSSFELMLGLALLFNIGKKFTYLATLILMVFFTILTLVLAITNPINDCGCFGDAVKLTNWQTFAKNAVLLLFIFVVWKNYSSRWRKRERSGLDTFFIVLFAALSVCLSLYGLRRLPLMDFLPFRVGTHISSAMETGDSADITTILVYKDITTGEQQEFSLSDTTWRDTTRWEFVDTRFVQHQKQKDPAITNFAVYNGSEDITDRLLDGEVLMFTFSDTGAKGRRCMARIRRALDYAESRDIEVIGVTSGIIVENMVMAAGSYRIPLYNIDATTLKTLIRAKAGLVALKDGTVAGKWSCYGIPDLEKYGSGNLISSLLSRYDNNGRAVIVISFTLLILLLYRFYRRAAWQRRD